MHAFNSSTVRALGNSPSTLIGSNIVSNSSVNSRGRIAVVVYPHHIFAVSFDPSPHQWRHQVLDTLITLRKILANLFFATPRKPNLITDAS